MPLISEKALLYSSILYYLNPCYYISSYFSFSYYRNPWLFLWSGYTLLPILDYYLPFDNYNPTKEDIKTLEKAFRFKVPLYLSIALDWLYCLWMIDFIQKHYNDLSLFEIIGLIWMLGHFATGNINIAHELMHKDNSFDKYLSMLTLSKNLYMHFWIEHVYGHHRRVGTKEDPATARFGEGLYSFIPRSVVSSYKSAWHLEGKRLKALGYDNIFTYRNRMIYFTSNSFVFPAVVWYFFGFSGMFIFLSQAIFSILYLETINYIEHYGLERKEISPGIYEKVNISHSWNAPHRFTNYLLFKLQRHSDHHENGYKPYQTLCTSENSPQLPHGYSVCVMVAYFPSLWFSVMNYMTLKYRGKMVPTKEEQNRAMRKVQWILFGVAAFFTSLMMKEEIEIFIKSGIIKIAARIILGMDVSN